MSKSTKNKKKKAKVIKFGNARWAASAFILLLIGGMCVLPSIGTQGIFESNFFAFEDDISDGIDMGLSVRGVDDDGSREALKKLQEGMDHYNAKEYQEAIPIFEDNIENHPDSYDARGIKFYLGVSYLSSEQPEKALALFEELTSLEKFTRMEDAKWYLALTHVRMEKKAEAKAIWQGLASSEKYGARAKKMIEDVDKPQEPVKTRTYVFR